MTKLGAVRFISKLFTSFWCISKINIKTKTDLDQSFILKSLWELKNLKTIILKLIHYEIQKIIY